MTLTIDQPQFVGQPCGHHGQYTFYKAFKYQKRNGKVKILMLGQFFFVRISAHDDPCIGELQLLWEDRSNDQVLSSTRLYFLPEQSPDGRQPNHGEHEVLAVADKVILRINDLVSWITDQVDWMTGLQTKTSMASPLNMSHSNGNLNNFRSKHHHQQALHPISINSGLDFSDVIYEKELVGDLSVSSSVVVLSYPRYCRYRALLRRIEGQEGQWMNRESVQMVINNLGIPTTSQPISVLFCRDTFEHEALLQHDLNCDHLAPKLKGRPRKKPPGKVSSGCQRSSSPESSTSDESKTSHIRTTRRSALNRQSNGNSNNNNSSNSNNNNNESKVLTDEMECQSLSTNPNAKLKELCIKNEQAFLKNLYKFMRDRKSPIQRVPHLGFKQIDLYFFYTHAHQLGGYDAITSNKLWKKLYDEMGGDPGSTSAATCTRRHYEKLLLPFERHLNGQLDRRRRRKAAINAFNSAEKTAKRGRKKNDNGVKKKNKDKVVNGVRGKKDKVDIDDDNDAVDENGNAVDGTGDDNEIGKDANMSCDSTPEDKQKEKDDSDKNQMIGKHPKLIVKLNLLKAKNESNDQTDDGIKDEIDESGAIRTHEANDDVETEEEEGEKEVEDGEKDVQKTENQSVQVKEIESIGSVKPSHKDKDAGAKQEKSREDQEATNTIKSDKTIADSVMQLSPVSDISCDDNDDGKCDKNIPKPNHRVSSNHSSAPPVPVPVQVPPTTTTIQAALASQPLHQPAPLASLPTSPLPFPVAASPLFSISSMVNSVKAEPTTTTNTATSAAISKTQTHSMLSGKPPTTGSSMRSSPPIVYKRPSVIHRTSNPSFGTVLAHSQSAKKSVEVVDKLGPNSVPLPAHRSSIGNCDGEATKRKISSSQDQDGLEVLDLSVKKRCLEADSRTSPSQIACDSPLLLDLSVKKQFVKELSGKREPISVSTSPLIQVPKPKTRTVSSPSSLSTNSSGGPQLGPSADLSSVSSQRSSSHNQSHSLKVHRELQKQQQAQPKTKHQHQQHQEQQQLTKTKTSSLSKNSTPNPPPIIKPQAHHPVQNALLSPLHPADQSKSGGQLRHSPTSPLAHPSSGLISIPHMYHPSISEYNPSLPSFYSTPSYWWQNAAQLPTPFPNASFLNQTSQLSMPMSPLSNHLLTSQQLPPPLSPYQTSQYIPLDSVKASLAAYKQLMDQGPYFFQQHLNNNYYATK